MCPKKKQKLAGNANDNDSVGGSGGAAHAAH